MQNLQPAQKKFKITGAAAAAANLLWEFNIAEKKDDKLTKNKKRHIFGNSTRARIRKLQYIFLRIWYLEDKLLNII